jgi:hypothetical protein
MTTLTGVSATSHFNADASDEEYTPTRVCPSTRFAIKYSMIIKEMPFLAKIQK